jgi:putative transcriptional regulator
MVGDAGDESDGETAGDAGEELAGKLLVAAPSLLDPNFARSVVLILDFNDEGALGVVLDRPTPLPVAELLPGWDVVATEPAVIHDGGPVGRTSAICLAQGPRSMPGFAPLPGVDPGTGAALGTLDLTVEAEDIAGQLDGMRVFNGYAGWTAGQLEAEIAEGAWYVVDSWPGDAFSPRSSRLWRLVLRRQQWPLALVSTLPEDPRRN